MADPSEQAPDRQADDADRHAFEHALARPDADKPSEEKERLGPFSLLNATTVRETMVNDTAAREISSLLSETAEHLFVGDGQSSPRQVRVELGDDVLPGVTVAIFEEEGRVVAHFSCAVERSRERLERGAVQMADELAQRLKRPVRVRVSTDDPEDPCSRQVDAEPQVANQDKRNAR